MELCREIILKFKRNEELNLIPAKETKVTSRDGPASCPHRRVKRRPCCWSLGLKVLAPRGIKAKKECKFLKDRMWAFPERELTWYDFTSAKNPEKEVCLSGSLKNSQGLTDKGIKIPRRERIGFKYLPGPEGVKSFSDSTGPLGVHLPPHTSSLPHLVLTPVGSRNHGYPGKDEGTEVGDMSVPLSPVYRGDICRGDGGVISIWAKEKF